MLRGGDVIAGRTRFYVVAVIVGAITGECSAGAGWVGLLHLMSNEVIVHQLLANPLLALAVLIAGTIGGAWAGVAVMRW
jgi:hypothetical protein